MACKLQEAQWKKIRMCKLAIKSCGNIRTLEFLSSEDPLWDGSLLHGSASRSLAQPTTVDVVGMRSGSAEMSTHTEDVQRNRTFRLSNLIIVLGVKTFIP